MRTNTFSMLLPIDKHVKFYESFLLQYSLIISSNLIIYELVDKSTDDEIYKLFESYHGTINDHSRKTNLLMGMGLGINIPQQNEARGLYLDKFFLSMAKDKKSPKFILTSFINAKEFILLYSIFEGVLKSEFIECGVLNKGKFLKEKDIMEYLEKKLIQSNSKNTFEEQLSLRSPLSSINDLELFWKYFTHFRHLYSHNGGYVTEKWLNNFNLIQKKLIKDTISNFSDNITAIHLLDALEEFKPVENKMFYITDIFTNIFRNYIIYIIESLYIIEDV